MFDLITAYGVVAAIFAIPVTAYMLWITFMFIVYKRTGGKRNFFGYVNLW